MRFLTIGAATAATLLVIPDGASMVDYLHAELRYNDGWADPATFNEAGTYKLVAMHDVGPGIAISVPITVIVLPTKERSLYGMAILAVSLIRVSDRARGQSRFAGA